MAEVQLDDAPRKAKEHFEKGFAALERGNFDYAMDMFESALDLCPGLLKARRYLRAAALKKAKGAKPNAIANAIAQIKVMTLQGQIKKKPEEAVKSAEKALRDAPLSLPILLTAAQAATAANMPEAAVMTLEVAKEHYPNDIKLLETLARLYTDVNQMHDARLIYEDLVRLKPNDPQAVRTLKDATALDTMQKGRWNEATSYRDVIKDTKQATRLEQENKAVKTGKDLDDLIIETQQKVQREPMNVNYKRALAELLSKAERYDEALAILEEAQQSASAADPQVDRAISIIKIRKFDSDIEKLTASGDADALAAAKQQRDDFLLSDAEERVRRYPNDLQFRFDLGVIYCERGRHKEAIEQLQQAQRNPQRRIRSLYYLALCFKAKEQYDLALQQLEKAASELGIMDETKKDIVYELGTISELMGNREKAAEYFKEIYSVDISYRDVSAKIDASYKK